MPGWRQPLPGRILRQTIMAHRKVLPTGHVWGYCIFRMLLSGASSLGIASVSNEIGLTAHRQPHSTTSDAPQTKQTHNEVGRRTTARSARRYKGYRGCSTSKQDLTPTSRLSTHSQLGTQTTSSATTSFNSPSSPCSPRPFSLPSLLSPSRALSRPTLVMVSDALAGTTRSAVLTRLPRSSHVLLPEWRARSMRRAEPEHGPGRRSECGPVCGRVKLLAPHRCSLYVFSSFLTRHGAEVQHSPQTKGSSWTRRWWICALGARRAASICLRRRLSSLRVLMQAASRSPGTSSKGTERLSTPH